jgi:transposase
VQVVWLRAALGLSAPPIAQVVGWQAQSVRRWHAAYFRHGEAVLPDKPQGGRQHAHLTRQQEQEWLAPFLAQAEAGSGLLVAPVPAA